MQKPLPGPYWLYRRSRPQSGPAIGSVITHSLLCRSSTTSLRHLAAGGRKHFVSSCAADDGLVRLYTVRV